MSTALILQQSQWKKVQILLQYGRYLEYILPSSVHYWYYRNVEICCPHPHKYTTLYPPVVSMVMWSGYWEQAQDNGIIISNNDG